ncbi:DUF4224 domain-containing protein [Burkholderia gladioli]|uniref:DUF4224 domain-containing protein n=1 Tax=Burkholderia gladioli TaxID=28095 RepID=UPI001640C09C|nr:DUF4224 domain-containing protein [Burkholderia gladioli]
MSAYLTASELADLVGCKPNQRAAMARWLDRNHWRYVTDANGLPKVARAYHDQKLGLTPELASANDGLSAGPDLDAFKTDPPRRRAKR